jgi:hypothetical protein
MVQAAARTLIAFLLPEFLRYCMTDANADIRF